MIRLQTSRQRWFRKAFSTAELLISLVLLATAAVSVSRFVSSVREGLQTRELDARLSSELINMRETIGSWSASEISRERIETFPFSDSVVDQIGDPQWVAEVKQIEQPTRAIQVELALRCTINGQSATPQQLIFWIDTGGLP